MGKGDKRTKRGKIKAGSFGNSRPKKKKNKEQAEVEVEVEVKVEVEVLD